MRDLDRVGHRLGGHDGSQYGEEVALANLTSARMVWDATGGVQLPNGDRADVGRKLEDYVLDPGHPEGRHKARVFESVLGVTRANAEPLRLALLDAARTSDRAEWRGQNAFGDLYLLRLLVVIGERSAMVTSAWIVRHGEDFPRLVTCYIP